MQRLMGCILILPDTLPMASSEAYTRKTKPKGRGLPRTKTSEITPILLCGNLTQVSAGTVRGEKVSPDGTLNVRLWPVRFLASKLIFTPAALNIYRYITTTRLHNRNAQREENPSPVFGFIARIYR